MDLLDANVILALRSSRKGSLKYDRYFEEEGRTKEIVEEIASKLTRLSISPKALKLIQGHDPLIQDISDIENDLTEGHVVTLIKSKMTESEKKTLSPSISSEKDLSILEYEVEQSKLTQELYSKKKKEYENFSQELLLKTENKYIQKQSRNSNTSMLQELLQSSSDHLFKDGQKNIQKIDRQELNKRIEELENKYLQEEKSRMEKRVLLALREHRNKVISNMKSKIEEALSLCDTSFLSVQPHVWFNRLNDFAAILDDIVSSPFTAYTKQNYSAVVQEIQLMCDDVISDVEQAQQRALNPHGQHKVTGAHLVETPKYCPTTNGPNTVHANSMSSQAQQRIFIEPHSHHEENEVSNTPKKGSPMTNDQKTVGIISSQAQQPVSVEQHSQQREIGALDTHKNISLMTSGQKAIDTNSLSCGVLPSGSDAMFQMSKAKDETTQKLDDVDKKSEVMEEEVIVVDDQKVLKSEQNTNDEAATEYWTAVEKLKIFEASLEQFKTNIKLKKYRMLLNKAVAINHIGNASGKQLKTKIVHLINLLSGETVEVGDNYVSCKEDPNAINYCKNLLAEKIVTQGEKQVQSKIDFAFPIAAVAVALCGKFPDFWLILLGHFFKRCPYLIPYYPEREEKQSDEEYLKCLGFIYEDGKLEQHVIYLQRMYGFAVLFAAILQTSLPPSFPAQCVQKIQYGWVWLSRFLNMPPKPDITATILRAVLEVMGHELAKTYDRQFKKMLHVLCKDYFPKMKDLSGATAGPTESLKSFLQSAITRGHIPRPVGATNNYFS